jgi:hypothetical protein
MRMHREGQQGDEINADGGVGVGALTDAVQALRSEISTREQGRGGASSEDGSDGIVADGVVPLFGNSDDGDGDGDGDVPRGVAHGGGSVLRSAAPAKRARRLSSPTLAPRKDSPKSVKKRGVPLVPVPDLAADAVTESAVKGSPRGVGARTVLASPPSLLGDSPHVDTDVVGARNAQVDDGGAKRPSKRGVSPTLEIEDKDDNVSENADGAESKVRVSISEAPSRQSPVEIDGAAPKDTRRVMMMVRESSMRKSEDKPEEDNVLERTDSSNKKLLRHTPSFRGRVMTALNLNPVIPGAKGLHGYFVVCVDVCDVVFV